MKKHLWFFVLLWAGVLSGREIEIGFPQNRDAWHLSLERSHAACAVTTLDGKPCLLLESFFNHLDPLGACSHVTCRIPGAGLKFKEVRVEVWSDTNRRLAVRFTDATRQTHQYRFTIAKKGEWQTLVCRFDTKSHNSMVNIWGGAKDKKWHDPITELTLVADNNDTLWPGSNKRLVRIYFGRVTLVCE